MSKVYNKVVQSNTEPSKNDIWLKDGQMKTFGKEGWKPIGGGSSLDANTPIKESVDGTELVPIFDGENKAVSINELVKGGKEVYYVDVEKYKSSIGRFDYENLREKINNPNTILVTTYEGSNYTLNLEEINDWSFYLTGTIALTYNKIKILYFNIFEEYGIGLMCNLSTKILTFDQSGDGTKFLSDDGTYKEISSVFRFINYADWVHQMAFNSDKFDTWYKSNMSLLTNIEEDKIVRLIKDKNDYRTINSVQNTYDNLTGETFITLNCDYGERIITLSKIGGTWTFKDTLASTSGTSLGREITSLERQITALEERIAALEGGGQ